MAGDVNVILIWFFFPGFSNGSKSSYCSVNNILDNSVPVNSTV